MNIQTDKKPFVQLDKIQVNLGGKPILQNVSLKLEEGVSYALIGKSGVGKTTLLRVIAGFARPTAGSLHIQEKQVDGPRHGSSYLLQDLGLFPWQTVTEAVSMPLEITKQPEEQIKQIVQLLLQDFGLSEHADKYPSELSGGQRQRTALARSLVGSPDLLLMDEPTSSLDTMTKESIQQLIMRQQQKLGATLLLVTHDIEEAVLLGQRIMVLQADGSIHVLDNPYYAQHEVRKNLRFYELCIELRSYLKDGGTKQ